MLLGSLSFIRFVQLARGEPGPLIHNSQIRAFLAIYAAFAVGRIVARRPRRRREHTDQLPLDDQVVDVE